jgi:uncharacterized caspase-like protein
LKLVSFRVDGRVLPFELFDARLNRPDLVLKTLGRAPPQTIEAYHRAYQKRLTKMKLSEAMFSDDFHAPEVAIASPQIKDGAVAFTVKAADTKYALDRLNVYVNDVPIYGVLGIDVRAQKAKKLERRLTVPLSNGPNKVQVSVLNDKGVESLKDTYVTLHRGQDAEADLYVVAIGVSRYKDAKYALKYAAKDADDLAKLLTTRGHKFREVRVRRLLDGDATKEEILAAKSFLAESGVNDEAVVFLAGHGLLDDKLDYYFATADVDFEAPALRGLPYEDVESLLDGIPARRKLLLIDTCHSGEVEKDETAVVQGGVRVASDFRGVKAVARKSASVGLEGSFELLQTLFADLRRGSGAVVVSSASGVEFALESPEWRNGVFTYALLEGLKSGHADRNKDGSVAISELRDYVSKQVEALTGGRQHPTMRQENLAFDFGL